MNKLVLSKAVYSENSIISAVNAYSKLAELSVFEEENKWVLSFLNCKFDMDLTIREFENYVIALNFMELKNACS